ncbi:NIM1K (predicted) [Pycnogonum litorale]
MLIASNNQFKCDTGVIGNELPSSRIAVTDDATMTTDGDVSRRKELDVPMINVTRSLPIIDSSRNVSSTNQREEAKLSNSAHFQFGQLKELRDSDSNDYSRSQEINQATPLERLQIGLKTDPEWIKELDSGKRIGFYKIRGSLGSGNFSRVNMAVHCLTKERTAMKIIDKAKLDSKTLNMLNREISNMEKVHHPNIVRLYEVIETSAKFHLVMECAEGGELFAKVINDGRMPEPEARPIFTQIVSAIEHLHNYSIVHRDLKAENIFLAGPRKVKLGDFGFSRYLSRLSDALTTFCGSPPYAAPELFQDDSYVGPYVDLWALGILLYFMVTAQMPFKAQNVTRLKKNIIEGEYIIPAYVSQHCQDLIEALLQHLPHERISIDKIKECRWLEGHEWPPSVAPSTKHDVRDLETRRHLQNLGITEYMLNNCSRGPRDPISATFRIISHKLEKGILLSEYYYRPHREPNNNSEQELDRTVHKKFGDGDQPSSAVPRKNHKSKTCNIL